MSVLIVLVITLALFGWAAISYNQLVTARNRQAEGWSGVDVQLKKRADLIPPLVACVSAYRTHESEIFRDATSLRSQQNIVGEMRSLVALAEAYPELKASGNFADLMGRLVKIEDDLQYARRYYNGSVRDFRNLAESFPSNLIAGVFGFQPGEFFEVETVLDRTNPQAAL